MVSKTSMLVFLAVALCSAGVLVKATTDVHNIPCSGYKTGPDGIKVIVHGLIEIKTFVKIDGIIFAVAKIKIGGGLVENVNIKLANISILKKGTGGLLGGLLGGVLCKTGGGAADGDCDILTLVLGPVNVNVLGLKIALNKVVLNIAADPTTGIVGNLLCQLLGDINIKIIALKDIFAKLALINYPYA